VRAWWADPQVRAGPLDPFLLCRKPTRGRLRTRGPPHLPLFRRRGCATAPLRSRLVRKERYVFLNLSLLQMLTVFGAVSAVSVALYLLDRSRRKQIVSTLRFWVAAEQPRWRAARHIKPPWSLILQL